MANHVETIQIIKYKESLKICRSTEEPKDT